MMFNSINAQLANTNILNDKKHYAKLSYDQLKSYPHQPAPALLQQSKFSFSLLNKNLQSPMYKQSYIIQSSPIRQSQLYQQNYDVKSPFQQNLRHSNVKSYTSQQYNRSTELDNDRQSENPNNWSRNTASYFPTSQLFNQQFYNSQIEHSHQKYQTNNPFRKQSNKQEINFDSFSNKSRSRIRQMNQRIDNTTQSILKNGMIHKHQPVPYVVRPSSQQRSRQKGQPEITRGSSRNQRCINQSDDRRLHSSVERKRPTPMNQQNLRTQLKQPSQNLITFNSSKKYIPETQYFKAQRDRISPFSSELRDRINGNYQESNPLISSLNKNKQQDDIDFLDFIQKDSQPSKNDQRLYRLPSTKRRDVTFNFINKDLSSSRNVNEKNDFRQGEKRNSISQVNLKAGEFMLPKYDGSQDDLTTFKRIPSTQISANRIQAEKNLQKRQYPPEFHLEQFNRNNLNQISQKKLNYRNQFIPTDLIVLKPVQTQRPNSREKQQTQLHHILSNQSNPNIMPQHSNTFNSKKYQLNDFKSKTFRSSMNRQASNLFQRESPQKEEEGFQIFRRIPSLDRDFKFELFDHEQQNKKEKERYHQNNRIKTDPYETKADNYRGLEADLQFKDFQDEQSDRYDDFGNQPNFQYSHETFSAKKQQSTPNQQFFSSQKQTKRQDLTSQYLDKAHQTKMREFSKRQTEKQNTRTQNLLTQKLNILKQYMGQMKDKQSQLIAIALIVFAVIILALQLIF